MATIILDFETSGLNPYYADIIEIGAKVLNSDELFDSLVKPQSGDRITYKITEITGISPKMLMMNGVHWKNAYASFYNWLIEHLDPNDSNTIVCHNGQGFDFIFLKRLLNDVRDKLHTDITRFEEFHIVYVDTLPVCRRLFVNLRSFKQDYLADRLNITDYGVHRALADVCTLGDIYNKILESLAKRDIHTSEDVVAYANLEI
jgi:DNA polymerase III subunit alpha, Gram-positive type